MKKIIFSLVFGLFFLTGIAYAHTYTTHLNLDKPATTDEYDITNHNDNSDKIDAALGTQHETTGEHKTITFKVDNTSDVGSSSLGPRDVFVKRNLSDGTNTATIANIKDAIDKKHPKYQHLKFTIIDPASVYAKSATICIWNKTDAAIHVTNIEFRCNADPTTEPTGDIKYADDLIGLGTPTLIAAFDTTAGTFSSGVISVAVAAGKCIYLSYDTTPDAATTQHAVDITFTYD